MRIIGAERRARLGLRHFLAPAELASGVENLAGALVGLHATDAPTVVLSAWARLPEFSLAELDKALYEDRTLVRMHGMRRTLFVISEHRYVIVDYIRSRVLCQGVVRTAV